MPTTYLLLRNNKQTGPHSLEALLQQNLKPEDLIWEEGRSAGWRYPAEIDSLKPFVSRHQPAPAPMPGNIKPERPVRTAVRQSPGGHSHIYVSLPAGRHSIEETPNPSLEAKAEALYQRVQAFAQGQPTDAADTRYARSLDDMKHEYGAWLVQQQKKKKTSSARKKLLIATSVLVLTTTSFGITKWMRTTSNPVNVPAYTLSARNEDPKNEPALVSFARATDTSTAIQVPALDNLASHSLKNQNKPTAAKKEVLARKLPPPVVTDTTALVRPMPAEIKAPVANETQKTKALSQLILVNGTPQYDKRGTGILATEVVLQNKSAEILKSVAVAVTYYKKEDKVLSHETVYFYNVQPGTASSVRVAASRRAGSVRFAIGTITRADGSLYLIH